jgi:hypothetical protein
MSENLALAGTVLGVISVSMGILILLVGPKPLIHYLIRALNLMWWNSIWGNYRYDWLKTEAERRGRLRKDSKKLDEIYLQVMDTWNPNANNIEVLYVAICKRRSTKKLFPLDLICKCILSAPTSYEPWKVIHAMSERMIDDEDIIDHELRHKTFQVIMQNLNSLVENMPFLRVTIQSEQTGEMIMDQLQKEVRISLSENVTHWCLLSYYTQSFSILQTNLSNFELTIKIDLNTRTKCYIALLNSFDDAPIVRSYVTTCLEFISSHPKCQEFTL